MREDMKYLLSLRFMARILWLGIAILFVAAEMVTVLVFRNLPDGHLFPGLGTNYVIVFVVALPMIAGMNGYYSVKRRLTSVGDDVRSVLSLQFLLMTVTAYVALLVCMEPMVKTLQPVLR